MSTTTSSTQTFTVTGMTCGGCVRRVRSAIEELDGVSAVDVRLEGGVVTVASNGPLDPAAVTSAVAETGYEAVAS